VSLLVLIASSIATLIAIVFSVFATAKWRQRNPVFAPFPTRMTAILASAVALKGWFEVLTRM
jgi:hypothetical protein